MVTRGWEGGGGGGLRTQILVRQEVQEIHGICSDYRQ